MISRSSDPESGEVWVLGAAGRIGRAVSSRLAARGMDIVLVGRDGDGLRTIAAQIGRPDAGIVVTDSLDRMSESITTHRPAVVVNTLGGYARTAVSLARAAMPGGHYVDLAVDIEAVSRLLDLHREAVAADSTLLTGAGFGVLATEALVVELCRDRPTPDLVRVDALGSVAIAAGLMGTAFAESTVDAILAGGRRYAHGRMVATRLGADVQSHRLPDGQTATSACVSSGELLAAQRASGAPNVIATSGLAPTSPLVRAVLPAAAALLSIPTVRRLAVRRIAKAHLKETSRPRTHSWGHAAISWPDGSRAEGWLRADDGMDYTADVLSETATRLVHGRAPAGAYTPAAALGPDLATAAGGFFIIDR